MEREPESNQETGIKSKRPLCFVIMPYSVVFDRYYKKVYVPAIESAGLEPIRADSLTRSSMILGDIWQLTRKAKVVLADMTGQNSNVFYELGLAHAIAKPVVLLAASLGDVPFDLRGSRVILYNSNDQKMREAVGCALVETIADTKSAVPPFFLEAASSPQTPKEERLMLEIIKLQYAIRDMKTSLPHWLRHVIATGGEADSLKRYVDSVKYLGARVNKDMTLDQGMKIMGCIFKGYTRAATIEMRKATGLSLEKSKKLVDEVAAKVRSPVD